MPEAVIVATARSPIGRAFKGSLVDVRPDDLAGDRRAGRPRQGARARPGHARRPDARLRRAGGEAGRQHGPPGRRGARLRHACPAPRSTGSAPRRCRPRGWPSTPSRRARGTPSSRPASSACRSYPAFSGAGAGREEFLNPAFDEARARTEATATHERDLARPARGRPAARRLHLDGPDRGEPRHLARHQPRRAGRVRRPLAEPGREGDRGRLLRPRDHAGHHAGRHRGVAATTAPARA